MLPTIGMRMKAIAHHGRARLTSAASRTASEGSRVHALTRSAHRPRAPVTPRIAVDIARAGGVNLPSRPCDIRCDRATGRTRVSRCARVEDTRASRSYARADPRLSAIRKEATVREPTRAPTRPCLRTALAAACAAPPALAAGAQGVAAIGARSGAVQPIGTARVARAAASGVHPGV